MTRIMEGTMRAAIYVRISKDRHKDELGVDRQDSHCKALVVRNGWDLVSIWSDNDMTAYSGKPRPGYIELCQAVRDGLIDVIVAQHPDRLHRSPRELEDFIDLLEASRTTVATVHAGEYDLGTAEGRMHARISGTIARHESERKSERIKDKHLELAEKGMPSGGRRSFGFASGGMTQIPAEVEVIREMAARTLAGESMWAMVQWLNEEKISTVTGAQWTVPTVMTLLRAPRLAGLRTHHGEIVAKAVWEPVLDRAEWEQVRSMLEGRMKRRERPARRYLLSGGIVRCRSCLAALVAAPLIGGVRQYACKKTHGGCGGVQIRSHLVEGLVRSRLFVATEQGILDAVRDLGATTATVDLGRAISAEEGKLASYAAMLDADEITRPEWAAMRQGATARLDQLRAQTVVRARPRALNDLDAKGLIGQWDEWPLERQRSVLRALLIDVVVTATGGTGPRFNPDRVSIQWRA